MTPLRLTTAFWNYDRTMPLVDGRVAVEGCELDVKILRPELTFARAFGEAAFDVCELSFSNSVTAISKGGFPYDLISVFLSRSFRHSAIFVRTDRGIERPEDLRGRIIGLQEYDMTAAVVVRGMLRDARGVEAHHIRWRVGEAERTKPIEFPTGRPPDGVEIELLPSGRTLESRLLAGELDAVIALRPPEAIKAGNPSIRLLFSDPTLAERQWYAQARIFPIMHALGVRRSLVTAHPDLPQRLYRAFFAAKAMALAELEIIQAPKITLPWPHAALAETRALMGDDPWPYGVAANRHVIEAQLRWSLSDGLQVRPVTIEDLFAPSFLES
ncbi:MAG: ABC transporter substrate-binding protein [Alphaproteobacteria bacterium]|nr:ABC transporter substrate-binding protein [Alphaproteobacteria bacterium]